MGKRYAITPAPVNGSNVHSTAVAPTNVSGKDPEMWRVNMQTIGEDGLLLLRPDGKRHKVKGDHTCIETHAYVRRLTQNHLTKNDRRVYAAIREVSVVEGRTYAAMGEGDEQRLADLDDIAALTGEREKIDARINFSEAPLDKSTVCRSLGKLDAAGLAGWREVRVGPFAGRVAIVCEPEPASARPEKIDARINFPDQLEKAFPALVHLLKRSKVFPPEGVDPDDVVARCNFSDLEERVVALNEELARVKAEAELRLSSYAAKSPEKHLSRAAAAGASNGHTTPAPLDTQNFQGERSGTPSPPPRRATTTANGPEPPSPPPQVAPAPPECPAPESIAPILAAAAAHGVDYDDDSARLLLSKAREQTPDVTADEVAHFIRAKGPAAQTKKSPSGFLLTVVPPLCRGESLGMYRAQTKPAAAPPPAAPSPPLKEVRSPWPVIRAEIEARLTPESFENWFMRTRAVAFADDTLTIATTDILSADYIREEYRDVVQRIAAKLGVREVRFVAAGAAS